MASRFFLFKGSRKRGANRTLKVARSFASHWRMMKTERRGSDLSYDMANWPYAAQARLLRLPDPENRRREFAAIVNAFELVCSIAADASA
jgi:hypothetical protein